MIACLRSADLPAFEEIVEAHKTLSQRRLGEVPQALRDELAVLVDIFDPLGEDGRGDTIDINFLFLFATACGKYVWGTIDDDLVLLGGAALPRVAAASSGGVMGSSSPGS